MAANSNIDLTALDFDLLKDQFKRWMQQQSVLKDYDYNGSNMNVLLDVMSYNSYLNAFYLNMVASEMFLDSAQKYDSIISHAKELNYIPRSAHTAIANVNITFQTSGIANTSGRLTIPQGTRFSGTNSNGNFQFVTRYNENLNSANDTFTITNLQISEGVYAQDSFTMDYNIENQRFVLSNKNADTTSLIVSVIENNGQTNTLFTPAITLQNLNYNSNVYFLQPTFNNKYALQFGDDNFGRRPLNSAIILAKYIVTDGTDGNGVDVITLSDDLGPYNGGQVNNVVVSVLGTSVGGSNQESIETVRFNAPRYFATQYRAVSSDDYASLIYAEFGGQVNDVTVYGGQDIEPKKYGRVIICLKPAAGYIAPNYVKDAIVNYLDPYIALPNRVEITDPDYYYVYLTSAVQYNSFSTTRSSVDIQTEVIDSIIKYSNVNLEKFGSDLRYSRLVEAIDNSDQSVVSNDTSIRLIKRITPLPNYATTYTFNTDNPFYNELFATQNIVKDPKLTYSTEFKYAALISSNFYYQTADGTIYPFAYLIDDTRGNIDVYAPVNGLNTYIDTVGTIDYANGNFVLNQFRVQSYLNYISIYMRTILKDLISRQDKIITIEPSDITVTVSEFVQ
jgi:hypothetical protein